jgi:protein-tyrosine-phosphatase
MNVRLLQLLVNAGSTLRGSLRTLRRIPDRMLHPWRRRRALRALSRTDEPRCVMFLCHGNICRSPYAAEAFREALPDHVRCGIQIQSAGFIGPDRQPPEEAVRTAAARGIDLIAHRSALVSTEQVASADLILVMDRAQLRAIRRQSHAGASVIILGDLDPHPIRTRVIADPYGQADDVFAASYARIDRCVGVLVKSLWPAERVVPTAGARSF